jgi:hypothetical protein
MLILQDLDTSIFKAQAIQVWSLRGCICRFPASADPLLYIGRKSIIFFIIILMKM